MNTIVGVSRLGISTAAIAAVGDDAFGTFLINTLREEGVDSSCVKIIPNARTTFTLVSNDPQTGERRFAFYRSPHLNSADSEIRLNEADFTCISNAKVLHISGFALSLDPARSSILDLLKHAKERKIMISFDPTLRLDIWESSDQWKNIYRRILSMADFASFSQEEAASILGSDDPPTACKEAFDLGVKIVGIKMGAKGCYVADWKGGLWSRPGFQVTPVDTTGAGDAWNAGMIVGLLRHWDIGDCATVANAIGAITVTARGAITSFPRPKEVAEFLQARGERAYKLLTNIFSAQP